MAMHMPSLVCQVLGPPSFQSLPFTFYHLQTLSSHSNFQQSESAVLAPKEKQPWLHSTSTKPNTRFGRTSTSLVHNPSSDTAV